MTKEKYTDDTHKTKGWTEKDQMRWGKDSKKFMTEYGYPY